MRAHFPDAPPQNLEVADAGPMATSEAALDVHGLFVGLGRDPSHQASAL
jgi:hypothetical protein